MRTAAVTQAGRRHRPCASCMVAPRSRQPHGVALERGVRAVSFVRQLRPIRDCVRVRRRPPCGRFALTWWPGADFFRKREGPTTGRALLPGLSRACLLKGAGGAQAARRTAAPLLKDGALVEPEQGQQPRAGAGRPAAQVCATRCVAVACRCRLAPKAAACAAIARPVRGVVTLPRGAPQRTTGRRTMRRLSGPSSKTAKRWPP